MDTRTPGLPLSALRWLSQEAQYLRAWALEARRQGPGSSPTIGQVCDFKQHSLTAMCLGGPVLSWGRSCCLCEGSQRGSRKREREREKVWVRRSARCPVRGTDPGSAGHCYRKTGTGGRVWPDALSPPRDLRGQPRALRTITLDTGRACRSSHRALTSSLTPTTF